MLFLLFSIFWRTFLKKAAIARTFPLTRSTLSTWVQAFLSRLDLGSSFPHPSPLQSELQFICPNSLLIPQLFLTPALLCTSIAIPVHPSYPLILPPVFLWLLPLPWTLFSFSSLTVISLLPLISLATSVLSSSAHPCFLLSKSNICPWSALSMVSGTQRRMFLSLVHIYVWAAYQQLLATVFLYSCLLD